jgi:P pilus assembly chaperone PapD
MISRSLGRARAIALALSVIGPLVPGPARAQIAVNELEVFLKPAKSAGRVGVIQVSNTADHAVQVIVDVQDWERDLEGKNVFVPIGQARGSCRGAVTAYPTSFRLDAGKSVPLRVSYEGSDTVGCWAIVFVQANERPPAVKQSHLTYVVRTGVKVYVEPPDSRRNAVMEDLRVIDTTQAQPGAKRPVKARVAQVFFRNTGEAHLHVKGSVEVRRTDGSVAATIDVPDFPVVPGALRRLDVTLPTLAAGKYLLIALLDYAGEEIAAGQAGFEVR